MEVDLTTVVAIAAIIGAIISVTHVLRMIQLWRLEKRNDAIITLLEQILFEVKKK